MLKVLLVFFASPKVHVRNLKVGPEMTCGVSASLLVVLGPVFSIREPPHGIVLVNVIGMFSEEFECGWPQTRHGLWGIVEVDSEAVSLVEILHVPKDVVIYITVEAVGNG